MPVTVTVYCPAADGEADILSVDVAEPPDDIVSEDGFGVALVPDGLDAASETVPLNLESEVTVSVELVEVPF